MSRLAGMERSHLPDYSIGATVLVVAIALPFFVFTRAEQAHRAGASRPPAATPAAQGVITTPDPTRIPSPSPSAQALLAKASPSAQPTPKQGAVHATTAPIAPTSAPTGIPSPGPDSAPVAALTLTNASAPLTVTADARGSTDTDQTPIAQVIFNFGDGTPATTQAGRVSTHTYANPGTYTVAVTVIDTGHLWSTITATVTVS